MTVDWKITVTTIYCDAIDSDVPVMVYRNGSTKCAGYKKYRERATEGQAEISRKRGQPGKEAGCEGPECSRILEYRDRLFSEKEGA